MPFDNVLKMLGMMSALLDDNVSGLSVRCLRNEGPDSSLDWMAPNSDSLIPRSRHLDAARQMVPERS